jgi:hypothetical protein
MENDHILRSNCSKVLAADANDVDLVPDDIVSENEIAVICAGLVTLDQESGIVRLIHFTTAEYLIGSGPE